MPKIHYPYPSQNGTYAVSKKALLKYCKQHKTGLQTVIHAAIAHFEDGCRMDSGALFNVSAAKKAGLYGGTEFPKVEALFAESGMPLKPIRPIRFDDQIEVEFAEVPGSGCYTQSQFDALCESQATPPEKLLLQAIWSYVTKKYQAD